MSTQFIFRKFEEQGNFPIGLVFSGFVSSSCGRHPYNVQLHQPRRGQHQATFRASVFFFSTRGLDTSIETSCDLFTQTCYTDYTENIYLDLYAREHSDRGALDETDWTVSM